MKFTAQEEYGMRCLLHLARSQDMSVPEIAEREGISVQYVGKLFRILGKGGVLESVRGRKGGYRLTRSPDQVSVAEVLAALGGTIYEPNTCERFSGEGTSCVHTDDCSVRSLCSGLQNVVDAVLSRVTLSELISGEQNMLQSIQVHAADIGNAEDHDGGMLCWFGDCGSYRKCGHGFCSSTMTRWQSRCYCCCC